MSQPFLSSVIRMDRESKQLSTHLSLLNDPLLPHRRCAPHSLPSSRRQNLKDMNPYLFAVITVRQNLNVMDFYVQLPFSRQSLTVFGKAAPLIRKGTLTFGIYHRPFPTGWQIAGGRAFSTAGVHQQHGQCRASARLEEDGFCSRHCHKYGKRNDRLILKKLTRQKQFAIQSI